MWLHLSDFSTSEFVCGFDGELSGVSEVISDSDFDSGIFVGEVEEHLSAEVSLVTRESDD